jgi:hypothetical protein
MTAEEPNDAVANTTAAIRDFFISYLAKKQPRPAAWFSRIGGTSCYQKIGKLHGKRLISALLPENIPKFNFLP